MPLPLLSMGTQAFALSIPILPCRHPTRATVRRDRPVWRPLPRLTVRACLPPSEEPPAPSVKSETSSEVQAEEAMTKTEQIAALLGQSKATMTASAEEVQERVALENRTKYGFALASTIVATFFFLTEKLNPNAGANLLHFLESNSAPLSAVGTNDKPSFIEFGAVWCENCKLMAKSVFELEKEYAGAVNFVVVDGDDPNNSDVVERFGVDGIPQFCLIGRDGSIKANFIGRIPKQVLAEDLDALLEDKPMPFPGLSPEELAASNS